MAVTKNNLPAKTKKPLVKKAPKPKVIKAPKALEMYTGPLSAVPKGTRRATVNEAFDKKQIKWYGIEPVSKEMKEKINNAGPRISSATLSKEHGKLGGISKNIKNIMDNIRIDIKKENDPDRKEDFREKFNNLRNLQTIVKDRLKVISTELNTCFDEDGKFIPGKTLSSQTNTMAIASDVKSINEDIKFKAKPKEKYNLMKAKEAAFKAKQKDKSNKTMVAEAKADVEDAAEAVKRIKLQDEEKAKMHKLMLENEALYKFRQKINGTAPANRMWVQDIKNFKEMADNLEKRKVNRKALKRRLAFEALKEAEDELVNDLMRRKEEKHQWNREFEGRKKGKEIIKNDIKNFQDMIAKTEARIEQQEKRDIAELKKENIKVLNDIKKLGSAKKNKEAVIGQINSIAAKKAQRKLAKGFETLATIKKKEAVIGQINSIAEKKAQRKLAKAFETVATIKKKEAVTGQIKSNAAKKAQRELAEGFETLATIKKKEVVIGQMKSNAAKKAQRELAEGFETLATMKKKEAVSGQIKNLSRDKLNKELKSALKKREGEKYFNDKALNKAIKDLESKPKAQTINKILGPALKKRKDEKYFIDKAIQDKINKLENFNEVKRKQTINQIIALDKEVAKQQAILVDQVKTLDAINAKSKVNEGIKQHHVLKKMIATANKNNEVLNELVDVVKKKKHQAIIKPAIQKVKNEKYFTDKTISKAISELESKKKPVSELKTELAKRKREKYFYDKSIKKAINELETKPQTKTINRILAPELKARRKNKYFIDKSTANAIKKLEHARTQKEIDTITALVNAKRAKGKKLYKSIKKA